MTAVDDRTATGDSAPQATWGRGPPPPQQFRPARVVPRESPAPVREGPRWSPCRRRTESDHPLRRTLRAVAAPLRRERPLHLARQELRVVLRPGGLGLQPTRCRPRADRVPVPHLPRAPRASTASRRSCSTSMSRRTPGGSVSPGTSCVRSVPACSSAPRGFGSWAGTSAWPGSRWTRTARPLRRARDPRLPPPRRSATVQPSPPAGQDVADGSVGGRGAPTGHVPPRRSTASERDATPTLR